jgi:hypothetical protein
MAAGLITFIPLLTTHYSLPAHLKQKSSFLLITPEVEAFLCYAPKTFTSGQALY